MSQTRNSETLERSFSEFFTNIGYEPDCGKLENKTIDVDFH